MISISVFVIALSFIYDWGAWGLFAFIPILAYSFFTAERHRVTYWRFEGAMDEPSSDFVSSFFPLHFTRLIGLIVIIVAYLVSWGTWIWVIGVMLIVRQRGDYAYIMYNIIRAHGITNSEEESKVVRLLNADKKWSQIPLWGYVAFIALYLAVISNWYESVQIVFLVGALIANSFVGINIKGYIELFVPRAIRLVRYDIEQGL